MKNSSEVTEKLRLHNFQGSQVSFFDFSTLYTSLSHDLLSLYFSNKKYVSYKCWTCAELCKAFIFLAGNIYVHLDDILYQQIVGISMGTNCAPLVAICFYFLMRRILFLTFTNLNSMTL